MDLLFVGLLVPTCRKIIFFWSYEIKFGDIYMYLKTLQANYNFVSTVAVKII